MAIKLIFDTSANRSAVFLAGERKNDRSENAMARR